ncbi:FeoA family protein [Leeia aquatica]|uniref:FeoA family protein n=1 Tax=Leeia aquatica TaxID=2725557 RepID=UPI00197F54D7|nr:FeoA family protein [Leeia aquatica]
MTSDTLDSLPVGSRAKVLAYRIASSPLRRRLLSLGLLPGAELEVLRRAPLGDPIEIRIRHTHLALRAHEAAVLSVERLGEV